jgi:type I restriction enzyme S subunit
MSKAENRGIVPRLRFPEFRGAGEWDVDQLSSLADLKNGYAFKSDTYDSSGAYEIVTIANVQQGNLILDGVRKISVLPRDIQKHHHIEPGDILISMTGNVGRVCRVLCNGLLLNQRVGKIVPKAVDAGYLYFTCQSPRFLDTMKLRAAGGAQGNLSANDILSYEICFPSHKLEQKKIADCLSSLDELITLEAQKLGALKTHKNGLMQELFPAEGETVPRLRFPEFRGAGGWDTKQLEEFAVIVRGGSPRPIEAFLTTDHNSLNWLKIGDIDKEAKFITATQEKVIPAALSKTRVVYPGDLILSNSMSFGRPYILKIETCIHDGWIAISEIHADIDRDYLYYLLMTSNSQEYFSNNAAGSGVQNLNADIIKRLPIPYPGIKEQQKIADCLSSLDELITAQAKKIESLKTHKKWFMQQLFPVLEETVA